MWFGVVWWRSVLFMHRWVLKYLNREAACWDFSFQRLKVKFNVCMKNIALTIEVLRLLFVSFCFQIPKCSKTSMTERVGFVLTCFSAVNKWGCEMGTRRCQHTLCFIFVFIWTQLLFVYKLCSFFFFVDHLNWYWCRRFSWRWTDVIDKNLTQGELDPACDCVLHTLWVVS